MPVEHRGFYERLRSRLQRSLLEQRGLKPGTVDALLLAPDLFMLLARLSLDGRVPAASRALIGTALVYFVTPFDLVPEALLGAGGFIDDLVLAAAVLTHALGPELDEVAAEHWSGEESVRRVLGRLVGSASGLLGPGRSELIRRWLTRRGVDDVEI